MTWTQSPLIFVHEYSERFNDIYAIKSTDSHSFLEQLGLDSVDYTESTASNWC